jgi:hypothetical protein
MSKTVGFKPPGPSDRLSIIGSTGSGKTRFASYLFSHSPFHARPYVIMDFKGDDLLERIPRKHVIGLNETPKHPGLYYVRPMPHEEAAVENFLWGIWKRGNCGVYIDEGYMLNARSPAFSAILTQGRSLKIPTTVLTQRPAGCSRFVFSEASHFAVFRVQDERDVMNYIGHFTPRDNKHWDFRNRIDAFHCRWYDVKRDYSSILAPVPGDDVTLQNFDDALRVKHKGI